MKCKKHILLLLSLLLLMQCMILPTQAAGAVETDREVSLTLDCRDGETCLVGMEFDLFHIAGLDAAGELTAVEPFTQFDVQIRGQNPEAWNELIESLYPFVVQNQFTPDHTGTSGSDGLLHFPTAEQPLAQRLYLLVGHHHIQDGRIYETSPFLVLLPGRDSVTDEWIYDVTAEPKFRWQPEETTLNRKVLKVWKDEGFEHLRPTEITVHLLRDGEVYDTVILNAENGWSYTWQDLSAAYQWTIQEVPLEGYTATVTREGITFVLTNSYSESPPPPPPPPDLPQTGQLWWPVPVLLTAGLICLLLGLVRRRMAP